MDQKIATAITFDTVGGPRSAARHVGTGALERRPGLAVLAVGNVNFAGVFNSLHEAPGDHLVAQLDTRLAAGHLLGATLGVDLN